MKQLLCLLLLLCELHTTQAQPQRQARVSTSEAFFQQHKATLLQQFGRLASEADLRFLLYQIIDRKHIEVDYNSYFRPGTAPLAYLMGLRHPATNLGQLKTELIYPLIRFVLPKTTIKPAVSTGSPLSERIALQAYQYLGVPYGAPAYNHKTGQGTLDCSGLVRYVFQDVGIGVNNISSVATLVGSAELKPVMGEPKPGDLLVRKHGNGRWSHVGIYVGNGQLIEAPYSGTVVRITPYQPTKWGQTLRHVRAYDTRT